MSGRRISVLRPAIELALSVARQGELDDPPVPAPARLRPFLGFTRMPPAALEAARRVVDDDPDFRQRVLLGATEEAVGEVGWAWLTRADGWEDLLAEAVGGAVSADEQRHRRAQDRAADRRAALASEAVQRAETERDAALAELERLRAEGAAVRRARRELQDEVERSHAEIVRLTEERSQAIRQLKSTEALLATRTAEARELRVRVRELDAELERAHLTAEQTAEGRLTALTAPSPGRPPASEVAAAPTRDELDRRALGQAVATASAAAAQLARALADASGLLAGPPRSTPPPASGAGASRPRPRRRPLRMPPGVFDDTPAAAEHLARVADVVFLVDGYNVSKAAWADLDLPTQRARLVDGLANFQARTGARAEVVFDGVDDGELMARSAPGRVRVRFTPSTVEADDLLLDLVDELPVSSPVVVVSSDRRVRDGARARGANTLSSNLLLAVLR